MPNFIGEMDMFRDKYNKWFCSPIFLKLNHLD